MENRDKVVLITGASSGIGKSTAEFLLTKGFRVYGTSRFPDNYLETKIKLLPLDVACSESIAALIEHIIAIEGRIDILINNAGVGIMGPMEELPISAIKNHFETNFFGPLAMMNAVLPYMRAKKKGQIINITSIAAYMGLPFRGAYSASKGALELATEAMRMEVQTFGINISCLAPGDVATDIASRRFYAGLSDNSPYKTIYQNSLSLMDNHVESGADPILLSKAIYNIICDAKPKVHYKSAAFMQKFSIVLKRVLPDVWYEKLVMNHYKIR